MFARSTQPSWMISRRVLAAGVLLSLALLAVGPLGGTAMAAPAAAYTSTNPNVDGAGELCNNGGTDATVNCNIYPDREYVWLNAGPVGAVLGDGDYLFTVLAPGGQGDPLNPDPGELLSTTSNADRTFSVSAGVVTYPIGSPPDPHDFDATTGKIRVAPYLSSPNGVYILSICRFDGVAVTDCKSDAFKVPTAGPDPVDVSAVFTGSKWRDDDQDGVFDAPDEPPLLGWQIDIFSVDDTTTPPTWTLETTETTIADGSYFFQSDAVDPGTDEHFVVCERQQAGWKQTAPTAATYALAQGSATNGATVSATADASSAPCYDVTTTGDGNATASFLDFGNIPTGDLSGAKYFDADTDGARAGDATNGWTEAGIGGWPIEVIDAQSNVDCATTTDSSGNWVCNDLDPGTYTVREVQATNTSVWQQTGNLAYQGASAGVAGPTSFVYTVTVANDAPSSADTLFFGNVCYVQTFPGGRTIGFWSNKNGQSLIGAGDLADLAALNLRGKPNSTTGHFDPATKALYRDWLLKAQSTVYGVYMLSAQLSATWLNTHNAFGGSDPITDPNYLVEWTVAGVTKTQSIEDWITEANTFLGGSTFPKTTVTQYKNLFDAINNNKPLGSAPGTPATCAAPVFPAP